MSHELRYDAQVVVVTGGGNGLGRAYANFFASRGAAVVVNDVGEDTASDGVCRKSADIVVDEIGKLGGVAMASYESVENGHSIIDAAVREFGRVDVLINNAGIVHHQDIETTTQADWDMVVGVNLTGSFKCTIAAWPHMVKQKYGRIINTSSIAGLFGTPHQASYCTTKSAHLGLTQVLANDGVQHNVLVNTIAPLAASKMLEPFLPPKLLKALQIDLIVPLVAVLVHSTNKDVTGASFEAGGGHFAQIRYKLAPQTFHQLRDFGTSTPQNSIGLPEATEFSRATARSSKSTPLESEVNRSKLQGKVVIVVNGGTGAGRLCCLHYGSLDAKIFVHDPVDPNAVVREIKEFGGNAIGVQCSLSEGHSIVKAAIDAYGHVDMLINDASFWHDMDSARMTDTTWNSALELISSLFNISKALWPYFKAQKSGKIVSVTPPIGKSPTLDQLSQIVTKWALIGLSQALAFDGTEENIEFGVVVPNSDFSNYTSINQDVVACITEIICHDADGTNIRKGIQVYNVGQDEVERASWQRSGGYQFPSGSHVTPEALARHWSQVVCFDDGRSDHPVDYVDGISKIMAHIALNNSI